MKREKPVLSFLPGSPLSNDKSSATPELDASRDDGGDEAQASSSRERTIRGVEPYVKPRKLRREKMAHEESVKFQEMSDWLNEEPSRIYDDVVYPIRKRQIKSIASATGSASLKDLSKKNIARPLKKALADDLFRSLKAAYMHGRTTLKDEYLRQKAGKQVASERVRMIRGAISDVEAAKRKELARIQALADLFSEQTTEQMVSRAADIALQSKLANLAEDEIVSRVAIALNGMSEAVVVSDLEGKVISAFQNGRNDAASVVADEIRTCYYSAIMDEGTCVPCAELDGDEHDFSDDRYTTPNPNCDYPPRCRCSTVYIFANED